MTTRGVHLGRFWREPLVHFVILAGLIFGAYGALGSFSDAHEKRVTVTITQIERMAVQWENTWGRRPSEAELQGLVRDHVREEIYYREGVRLGLDLDDAIIRNRVRQKMEQFSGDGTIDPFPTDVEILEYYEAHADRYLTPPRVSFHQVYFANVDSDRIAQALARLDEGADPAEISDPLAVPTEVNKASNHEIVSLFGAAFAARIAEMEMNDWVGPISSGFGQHLVRVSEKDLATFTPLREVRDLVIADWTKDTRATLLNESYQALREKYHVEIETP